MTPDRASHTALLIARSLTFTSGNPELPGLVPIESAQLARAALAARSPAAARLHRWLCAPGMRWLIRTAEAVVLPGIQLHYALRKLFLDDTATRAIEDGARQVVVVGAGFDSLALRLSRRPERIACIEVDHPATQAVKRRALAAIDSLAGDLRLVPADLGRESLSDALARGRFAPSVKTLFVAEGLTMYLHEHEVKELLRTCADDAPAGSRFAWTFMEPDEDGRIAFRRSRRGFVDAWLRARGEPFTWGIDREAVAEFVRPLGLELLEIAGAAELRARFLAPLGVAPPLAIGESLCVVRKP
jgi:methyltransferase (TIGR00027 family)